MKQIVLAGFMLLSLIGCAENTLPKPNAYLSLNYPTPSYQKVEHDCPYNFDLNQTAKIISQPNCWNKIVYPEMKATVYLSYVPVKNNLDSLLYDAYQMPSKHVVKAEEIPESVFQNPEKRVYGTLFSVVGEAASQVQFFLTDSTDHFLVGSLYFYTRPNYDSLLPATQYVENDMMRLMESFEWKD
ncbi:MAG: gliding motility lipoprotein GldD [Flavobacteriaceae bacterium]|jgi:gliding motility-associated lipoprotein GldD|nr:gliding motility lipoprotein GldD [Flavobacteriaceae bacterium]MDO7580934.1 gliding motility lipoprotein GldD [Flavobacteriaceae bacterium]MDO7591880.1 gliding motility lipoprotein GldD [Flavobacteriaceae bacterium]MDO7599356.1 gliding motility lipoprotein GldD [Flavobacteriaceae bacterium]MDO7603841.1 gliding motility lipoprotein GldD [Flavobacteriaceae bacterium]